MLFVDLANNVVIYYEKKTDIAIMILSVEMSNGSGIMSLNSPGGSTYGRALLCLAAVVISPYSVAFGVILSLLFFCLFVRLRISQRRMVRSA